MRQKNKSLLWSHVFHTAILIITAYLILFTDTPLHIFKSDIFVTNTDYVKTGDFHGVEDSSCSLLRYDIV